MVIYHLDSVVLVSKLYYHSNGFRGSIDSPLRSIQAWFCISCTTIWKDPNKVLYELTYHSKPFGESTCMEKVPKVGGLITTLQHHVQLYANYDFVIIEIGLICCCCTFKNNACHFNALPLAPV